MASTTPNYYGNDIDINLAKQNGVQGNFYDVSKYGQGSILKDLQHAYKTGGNPVILGGAGAIKGISADIENQLRKSGTNINRIGGNNRYDVQNALNRFDTNNKINSLYDQRKQSIQDQSKSIAPQYAGQRNQADVVNQQNVSKLREIMAASGLMGSGENVTANIGMQAQRQNSLNDINIHEQQARNEINQRALEMDAQRTQSLLEADRYLDDRDYQYGRDKVADKRYVDQFNYQAGRDKVADNRYSQEQNYQKQQNTADKAWREYTFKNMSATEKAQMDWAKSQYGEDAAWRMFELNYNGEMQKSMNDTQIDAYKSDFLTP